MVVVVGLFDSNTTPGYKTILCCALDCGNMYRITLYCKGTQVVVVVVVTVVGLFNSNTTLVKLFYIVLN